MKVKEFNRCDDCPMYLNKSICAFGFKIINDSSTAGGKAPTYNTYSKECTLEELKMLNDVFIPKKIKRIV